MGEKRPYPGRTSTVSIRANPTRSDWTALPSSFQAAQAPVIPPSCVWRVRDSLLCGQPLDEAPPLVTVQPWLRTMETTLPGI